MDVFQSSDEGKETSTLLGLLETANLNPVILSVTHHRHNLTRNYILQMPSLIFCVPFWASVFFLLYVHIAETLIFLFQKFSSFKDSSPSFHLTRSTASSSHRSLSLISSVTSSLQIGHGLSASRRPVGFHSGACLSTMRLTCSSNISLFSYSRHFNVFYISTSSIIAPFLF
jgi:hypothetical protein